jgi:integrase
MPKSNRGEEKMNILNQTEIAGIMATINGLCMQVNALMPMETVNTENAEKIYGFRLFKVYNKANKILKEEFTWAVSYKDHQGKWIPTHTSTHTNDKEEARRFAIQNKQSILEKFYARKEKNKNNGANFYKMLADYYVENSIYLKKDDADGERKLDEKRLTINRNFINLHLIPFFKSKTVTSIDQISREIYSNIKEYVQTVKTRSGEIISINYANKHLLCIMRVLRYAERRELIDKLPYSKGTALLKVDKSKVKQPALLPTEYLEGILHPYLITGVDGLFSFLLGAISLCCGLRNSEIERIKRSDIKFIKACNAYIMEVENHKTENFHHRKEDTYRKIPMHTFLIDAMQLYCKEKNIGKEDYVFSKKNRKGEYKIHDHHFDDAIQKFYRLIMYQKNPIAKGATKKSIVYRNEMMKEMMKEKNDNKETKEKIEKEMKKNNVKFYSFRHTFETMLGMEYPDHSILIDYVMGHTPSTLSQLKLYTING